MKYLFVVPYFVPAFAYGGPVKVVFTQATKLAERGHSVAVYTTDVLDKNSRYKGPRETSIKGVQVKYFPVVSNTLAYHINYFRAFGFYKYLKKTINDFDFVFIHDFFTYQSRKTASLCKTYAIPYSITPHGVLSPVHLQFKKIVKKLYLLTNKHILNNASHAIALTQYEQKILAHYLPQEKIKIIPNGIDLNDYINLSSLRGNLRNRLNLTNKKIVVFIGRLQTIKGLDILAHAFRLVLEKINDANLLIVGPDEGYLTPLQSILTTLGISSSVIFTGLLKEEQLFEVLADADVFALTSYSEGLPISVLEAAASGLPCIISKECNVPEISTFRAGFVVSNEPEIIADRIIRILENDKLRSTMGIRAQEMVRDQFSWKTVIDKIETITMKCTGD